MSVLLKKDTMNQANKGKRWEYSTSEFIQDFKILFCDPYTFTDCIWSPNHNKTKGCMLRKSNKYLFSNHIYTNYAVYSINDKDCFTDTFANIIDTFDKFKNGNDKFKVKFGSPYINNKTWTVIAKFTHPIDKRLTFEHDGFNNNCIITHMPTKKKYAYLYKRWSKYSKLKPGVRITKINNEAVIDTAHDYIQSLLDDVQKHDTYTITFEYGRIRWYKAAEYLTAANHDNNGSLMQKIDIRCDTDRSITSTTELLQVSTDRFRYCGKNILTNYDKSTVSHNCDTKSDQHKVKSPMELSLPDLIRSPSHSVAPLLNEYCAYGSHFIASGKSKWTIQINKGKNVFIGIFGVTNNFLLSNELFTLNEYGYGMNNNGEVYNE
eukprot:279273_1